MGSSVQWRGENQKEPARYGKSVSFGNLRDKGSGYMSYSERVGPGVLVLGGSPATCDWLTSEGFTALSPNLPDDLEKAERLVDAAVAHLVENWHPRVGVLAFGTAQHLARRLADRTTLDGMALFEREEEADDEMIDDFRYDLS